MRKLDKSVAELESIVKPSTLNKLKTSKNKYQRRETILSREDIRHPNIITSEGNEQDKFLQLADENDDTKKAKYGRCKKWWYHFEESRIKPFLIYNYESNFSERKKAKFLEQMFSPEEKVLD